MPVDKQPANFVSFGDITNHLTDLINSFKDQDNLPSMSISKTIFGDYKESSICLIVEVTTPIWITHYIRLYRHGIFTYEGVKELEDDDQIGKFERKFKTSLSIPEYIKAMSKLLVTIEDATGEQMPQEVWEYLDEK